MTAHFQDSTARSRALPSIAAPGERGGEQPSRQGSGRPTRQRARNRRCPQSGAGRVRELSAGNGRERILTPRLIPHSRLDKRLAILARRPELFARDALRLCQALEARGFDLEISDPSAWRGAPDTSRVTLEKQFSAEIDTIRTMGREEELRLALRIEFARLRLGIALQRHGLDMAGLADGSSLPPAVSRRKLEWHTLRLEMVERNLYLLLINVERYSRLDADRSDLIQAAAAALFRAVDGFDWRRGVLFRTYAVYWLHQGFRTYLYDLSRTVRVPIYLQKSIRHINAALQRLGDPYASSEDIARDTGLRSSMVASARAALRRTRSLDAPLDGLDGTHTLASDLPAQDDEGPYSLALEDISIASGVEAVLGTLTDRERLVVEMRFGIGCGREHIYSEVAQKIGVSLERVRQILMQALSKMRTSPLRRVLEPLT